MSQKEPGFWARDMNGERRFYASPERERCYGRGWMPCYCGGGRCVCANVGEIECDGCEDCEPSERDDDADDVREEVREVRGD